MALLYGFLPVYVLVVTFSEYALKALFESLTRESPAQSAFRSYALYRLSVFAAHAVLLSVLFDGPWSQILAVSGVLTIVGSFELITAAWSRSTFRRLQRTLQPLHLIDAVVMSAAILITAHMYAWPFSPFIFQTMTFDFPFSMPYLIPAGHGIRWILVYFLASVPANYVIRWLMNKSEDMTLPDTVMEKRLAIKALPKQSPRPDKLQTPGDTSHKKPSLRAGRIIGILERWLVIALLTRGELAAIGFVFAAKSIVRYPQFDDPDFAEYYLIGTLYSVVIALVLSSVLRVAY